MSLHPNCLQDSHLSEGKNLVAGYALVELPTFGENLRRLQKKAGIKGVELARRTGVKPPTVSAWLNNKGGLPETPTLFKLAKALNCSIEELLSGVDAEYAAAAAARAREAMALFGPQREIDFDEPGAWDRFNTAQRLLSEARDAEEHGRIAAAIRLTLASVSDLPRHPTDQESNLPPVPQGGGSPDVPASDAIGRLESIRERDRTLAGEVQDVIGRLALIAAGLTEEAAADPATAPSGARGHRKARRRRAS